MTSKTTPLGPVAAAVFASAGSAVAGIAPVQLRCEYLMNPLGIDAVRPRLSWALSSAQRGQTQSAYQVLVASSPAMLADGKADLWDSGKVKSNESLNVVYAGKLLRSGACVHWKIRVWDRAGRPSDWSAPGWWEMALLKADDWHGLWISRDELPLTRDEDHYAEHPAPLLRKAFKIDKKVVRARAYVSGLGYYELRINGRKVGDHLLDPGWTTYAKRVLYATYDVTDLLASGENVVGIALGNGWYNPLPMRMWGRYNLREHLTVGQPRGILQLNVDYADGSQQMVVTDEGWKVGDGPILRNSVYLGEVYDARREQTGWDRPGFDDASWRPAVEATLPVGPLRVQTVAPIKAMQTVKPVKITTPKPGVHVVDMGQNFAGRVRLRVKGRAGTKITLRCGELLYPDGTLNGMTSVAGQVKAAGRGGPGAPDVAYQTDTYILSGRGEEVYAPRFTFHGFRYVEARGWPGTPPIDAFEGELLCSAVAQAGSFACSNELYNRIQEMVIWTQRSNMFSVQSDCPHREKFGYGGDIVASSEMAMLNLDMSRFYAKVVEDFADAARPNGAITETAPYVGIGDAGFGGGSGPIGWGLAHPLLLWQRYQYYGDKRLMSEQYDVAGRWVDLLIARAKGHLLPGGISDHESLVPKPVALTGTAFYAYHVRLMSQIARVLGRKDDADRYAALFREIRDAFNARFLKPATGQYDSGSQACQAFALYLDLVRGDERRAALDVLVKDVMAKHKGHLTTGIFGTKYMLMTLSDLGRADVAATVVAQKAFPGWGHMLERGATTLWEHWEYSDNTFSHNHPMFGSVSEWFYKVLAGINVGREAVGFDRVTIRPRPVGDLTWVKAAHDSVRGRIVSAWKIEGGTFVLDVEIPPNTSGVVFVPAADKDAVTEGGRPADKADCVEFVEMVNGTACYRIDSGRYRFASSRFRRPGA